MSLCIIRNKKAKTQQWYIMDCQLETLWGKKRHNSWKTYGYGAKDNYSER